VTGTSDTRVASLVDGGYFDNSGLGPTIRWVQDRRNSPNELGRIKILHLYNAQERTCTEASKHAGCRRIADEHLHERGKTEHFGWLTRPLDAIFAVREQHSLQRIHELSATFGKRPVSVALALPEPPHPPRSFLEQLLLGDDTSWRVVGLGWTLSPED